MLVEHLYVHVPFCLKICPYCNFFKEEARNDLMTDYVEAVLGEAAGHAETVTVTPRTIFVGGGTPSALGLNLLQRLLQGLAGIFSLRNLEEFTLEMNPATVTPQKAAMLLECGVNRVSMGVQSWSPKILEALGRVHSVDQAIQSYEILRAAGFQNINLDLIFAVPGQSLHDSARDISETVALGPDHISAYCLTYEEDTEFFLRLGAGEFEIDPEREADFFEQTTQLLEEAGYEAYEISNFSRPGRACRHNQAYWTGMDYLGLGPGAWSTVGECRWMGVPSTEAYIAQATAQDWKPAVLESVDAETRRAEILAFGLRTREGVSQETIVDASGEMKLIMEAGLVEHIHDRVRLTGKGRLLADEVAARLL